MKNKYIITCLSFILTVFSFGPADAQVVKLLTLKTAITPVSSEYILKAIEEAENDEAECLVIQLDTPGGLMTSMKDIIQDILGSQIPVIVYVGPSGATSGSAGVFITMSAHIAAMAPATNIGAAHPVNLGTPMDSSSVMEEKITNDAAAYARSIAEKRGKNADWAEKAVRESVSITATEALEINVIDLIAPNLETLLSEIDGKEIEVALGTKVLNTKNARIQEVELGFRFKILDLIVDPNIAYILMMIGMAGVMLELYNPGTIFPGVVGGICLILAFYAMQTLPVNYAGLLLILVGVILFILEVKITSYGLLSIGGVVSLTIGSIMLFDSPLAFMRVSWKVIVPVVILTSGFFLMAIWLGLKAQMKKPTTGKEGLVGEKGKVTTVQGNEAQVAIHGEIWTAVFDEEISEHDAVEVVSVDNLIIKIRKIS
ncbi:nodulation protein NfeD [candidate division KSB1 bacterium]